MIYFDYASTSIKRKNVIKEMFDHLDDFEGNPDSIHQLGRKSKEGLEKARRIIAKSIGASSKDILFTSGASESNNMVTNAFQKKRILSSSIEHPSLLKPLGEIQDVRYVPVNSTGAIDINEFYNQWDDSIDLVIMMAVNNETGIIQPIEEIGAFLENKKTWFHVDAVQAYGHIDLDIKKLHCDSMSLSGHKIGALNGIGILYLKNKIKPLILGGDQEKKRRAGTSNALGAYSMARSIECIQKESLHGIKKYFLEILKQNEIPFDVNGDEKQSVEHILNIYFPFIKSEFLITYLDMKGICVSAGSACSAGSLEPSNVITLMYDKERAARSVRFSFGYLNTKEEVDQTIACLKEIYERQCNE